MTQIAIENNIFTRKVQPRDTLATIFVYAMTALVIIVLALPMYQIVVNGAGMLSLEYLTQIPTDAGRSGGVSSILVSTLMIVFISILAALPLAFGAAVLLTEFLSSHSIFASIIRCSLDVLAGVPSVVFGLFGLAFFCQFFGLGYSILAGGLTLACMILPTLARAICSAFDAIGEQYRVSGAALSLSKISILWRITLPIALPGIMAGVVLALSRAIAETALLLFTSGYSDRMPTSVTDSGRSMSVHIYELATNVPGGQKSAYAAALVLLITLMLMSIVLNTLTRKIQRKLVHVE